jgi:hypothetical protein
MVKRGLGWFQRGMLQIRGIRCAVKSSVCFPLWLKVGALTGMRCEKQAWLRLGREWGAFARALENSLSSDSPMGKSQLLVYESMGAILFVLFVCHISISIWVSLRSGSAKVASEFLPCSHIAG